MIRKDVTLNDRIILYYQNVSLCEEHCTFINVSIETFEVECSCSMQNTETKKINEISSNLLNNSLSSQIFGFIINSNIGVLKCIKEAFDFQKIMDNYGGLMMTGLFFIQIIATIFYIYQSKQYKQYIFSIINKFSFPPKKIINKVYRISSDDEKKDISFNSKDIGFVDLSSKDLKSNISDYNNNIIIKQTINQGNLIDKKPKKNNDIMSLNYIPTGGNKKEKFSDKKKESFKNKNVVETDNLKPNKLSYETSNNSSDISSVGDSFRVIMNSSQSNSSIGTQINKIMKSIIIFFIMKKNIKPI